MGSKPKSSKPNPRPLTDPKPPRVSVGGQSPAMLGNTLWSAKDEVSQDELGLQSAKLPGTHVAEVALKLFKNA
jgi:hypothetical protein